MSFHDNLQRQEQEKRRAATWPPAVRQLCWFIRGYLRKTAGRSALAIKSDLMRVENALLDRLTIFLDGETVTIAPLGLRDSRTPEHGGCVMARSTTGASYRFLWDGGSAQVDNHWSIAREDDDRSADIKLDHLTVFIADSAARADALSETTLDHALGQLFAVSVRLGQRGSSTPPPSLSKAHDYRAAGVFGQPQPLYRYQVQKKNGVGDPGKPPPQ